MNELRKIVESIGGTRDYECVKCCDDFSRISSLKRHVESLHEKRVEFECENCKKVFGRKNGLKDQTLSGNGDIFCVKNERVYLLVGEDGVNTERINIELERNAHVTFVSMDTLEMA